MKSQRREKIARRSSSYISCEVYHDAGKARTADFSGLSLALGESAGFPNPKKLNTEVVINVGAGENELEWYLKMQKGAYKFDIYLLFQKVSLQR